LKPSISSALGCCNQGFTNSVTRKLARDGIIGAEMEMEGQLVKAKKRAAG
jgi:hypothetical protein